MGSLCNNHDGYLISFISTANTFDNPENIEIREHFIKSIKFLNGLTAGRQILKSWLPIKMNAIL